MKLSIPFALLATAGLAVALDVPTAPAKATDDCCTASAPVRSSYLELANPPAPGEVSGKVKGKVVFEGDERPEIDPLEITEQQGKGCTADGSAVSSATQTLLIATEGGIKNCVIEISVKGAELKLPEKPIELDQAQCRFEPHVILVPAGATVEFLNSDTLSHNVHTYSKRTPAKNLTQGAGVPPLELVFEKPEAPVRVGCDIHPWMTAWVGVFEHPFFDVTAEDGAFALEGLPPGKYSLSAWHEELGKQSVEVELPAGGAAQVDFTFQAK